MAKLYFKYGAMNSGKTIEVLRTYHNYKERKIKVVLIKPKIDTKGNDCVISRIGLKMKVDYLISTDIDLIEKLGFDNIKVIVADEAQFFTPKQIEELWYLSKVNGIDVLCYGLRCDFRMKGFPGSTRLLELADSIDEIKTICKCGKKATQNIRLINDVPIFDGEQISIDGEDNITYDSVCGDCYIRERKKASERKINK